MNGSGSNSDENVFAEHGSSASLLRDMPRSVSPATPEITPAQVKEHATHVSLEVGTGEPQLEESPTEDKDWYLMMDELKNVQKSLEDLSMATEVTPVESKDEAESTKESIPSEIQSNSKPHDQSDPEIKEEKPVLYPRTKIKPIPKQRPFSSQDNIFPVSPIVPSKESKRRSVTVSGSSHVASSPQKSPPIKPQPVTSSSALATSSPPTSPGQERPISTNQIIRSSRAKSRECRVDWKLAKASSHPSISEAVEVITLTQLVEEQSKHFPMSVVAFKGLEGQVLSKSIINMHFLKITKVIDGSDAINQRYLFPYNSSIRFGIVYCPGIKTESFIFEKVSDIIRSTDLPKVVACMKKVKNKNEKLEVNEILIVKEIITADQQKVSKKSQKLKVFSFTKKSEKILSGDLNGRFTTDPKQTALFLPDIINYIPTPFPVCARLFPDGESQGTLPDIMTRETVQLLSSSTENSVVASCTLSSTAELGGNPATKTNSSSDGSTVVEIPINQNILVTLPNKDPQEKSDSLGTLHTKSHAILKDMFSTSIGKNIVPPRLMMTSKANAVQQKLYAMTRKGWEREGQSIKTPKNLSSLPTASPIYQPLTDGLVDDDSQYTPILTSSVNSDCWSIADDSYDDSPFISNHKKTSTTTVSTTPGNDEEQEYRANQRMVRRIEALELKITKAAPLEKVQRLTRRVEGLDSRLLLKAAPQPQVVLPTSSTREKELEKEVESLRVAYKDLKDEMKSIQNEMKEMMEKMKALPATIANVAVQPHKQQSPEENIVELKELNEEQVGKLLEALGLHQYKPRFFQESITGEILAECNEDVLTQDLGMRDHGHCTKIMQLIEGKYSPLALIADYSYVRFKSNQAL